MCQLPESVTVTGFSPFKGKKKREELERSAICARAAPGAPSDPWVAHRRPSRGVHSNPLGGRAPPAVLLGPPGTQQRAPGNRSGPTGRGCFVNSIPFKVDPAAWTQLCSFFPLLSFQSYATHFDLQRSGRLLMWKLLVFINDLLPCSNLF